MIIPLDRQHEEAAILERIKRGQRIDHFETVRRRKHGSLIDISLTISPIRNAQGKIIGSSKTARDITERKRAHERQLFLIRELQHRTQNLFMVVQSVINLTLVEPLSLAQAKEALNGRIKALAQAHSILADHAWNGGPLTDIIGRVLASFSHQLSITGCDMTVNTQAAQHFALTLHELATNAVKYGALSVPTGSVSITCTCDVERIKGGTFSFLWKESGGPIVLPPQRKGFGTAILIDGAKQFGQHVALDYEPDGLKYEIRFPLSAIETQGRISSGGDG
jgi:two-component sensor histidine kinase